jgi:hypothetical protein
MLQIIIIVLVVMGRTYYSSTDFVYIRSVKHNLKVLWSPCLLLSYKQNFIHNLWVLMIYLHTKFQMPSSNDSLVITITLKAK